MKKPIYLDNHATTPCDPHVIDAMLPYFSENFGNASSRQHRYGWDADAAVEHARSIIASSLKTATSSVIFTSGATESNNLVLKGICEALEGERNEIVTCATEHSSVLDVCRALEKKGFVLRYVPVDGTGLVNADALCALLSPRTALVSIMTANNEVGTLAPLKEIGLVCRQSGVRFHTDAAQAYGKIPLDMQEMNLDILSLSAHKLYGPKGVGALVLGPSVRRSILAPQQHGGGHESHLRAGTLNVPGIVGFGKAAEIAQSSMTNEADQIAKLRDRLQEELLTAGDAIVNGNTSQRLSNNLNIRFAGVPASSLIARLKKEVAFSSASACSTADPSAPAASHVLLALGLSAGAALSSVRFGLGRFTTEEDVVSAAAAILSAVRTLRRDSREGVFVSPSSTTMTEPA
ncbi:MAG: cysteine desulfurase family protein [Ignavibacteriales bacterium]|nr:cysteine desulfurase family protein [Ignavibacteriales bacterium]